MRILHVNPTADPSYGGPIAWTLAASRELNSLGHSSEIVTVDDPTAECLRGLDVTVHALGPGNSIGYSQKLNGWMATNLQNYDFVVNHAIFDYCCYASWRALKGNRHLLVTFPHGMLDPYFNKISILKTIKKYLFWPWAIYPQLRDAAVTLFTTEEEKILARQSFRPYQCNEQVIAYGISKPAYDLEACRTAFLKLVPEADGRPFLLYLSRIHPKKGVDLLIEAFAENYGNDLDTLLVVAGPDQTGIVDGLKAQAQARGIDKRIAWPGMLKGDPKWGAFEMCEAFVLPSHQENFGQVVAEAMSCAKPVLISDKVNIHHEVSSSGGGLVGPDDQPGTNGLLARFKAMDAAQRAAMGQASRDCFLSKFELKQSVLDFVRVLERTKEQRPRT